MGDESAAWMLACATSRSPSARSTSGSSPSNARDLPSPAASRQRQPLPNQYPRLAAPTGRVMMWWWTHGLPPVGVAAPGITLIARCLRGSGVDAVPATGAGERVDERPVARGRSPPTFAAQHLGSTCWLSSVSRSSLIANKPLISRRNPRHAIRAPTDCSRIALLAECNKLPAMCVTISQDTSSHILCHPQPAHVPQPHRHYRVHTLRDPLILLYEINNTKPLLEQPFAL